MARPSIVPSIDLTADVSPDFERFALESHRFSDSFPASSGLTFILDESKGDGAASTGASGAIQPTISSGHVMPATTKTIFFCLSVKAGVNTAQRTMRVKSVGWMLLYSLLRCIRRDSIDSLSSSKIWSRCNGSTRCD
jgi:hypothetical protein